MPIIDVAVRHPADRTRVATLVAQACRDVGAFRVTGHGLPADVVAGAFDASRAFFDLPLAARARVAQPAPDQVRGWSPVGSESVTSVIDEDSPGDLKEKMDMGPPEVDPVDLWVRPGVAGPHFAPNLWPAELPGMASAWTALYRELDRLGGHLLEVLALSLGLPRDTFVAMHRRQISMLRGFRYPALAEPPLPGQLRAGVHTDSGSLTLVLGEDRPGGLQVLDSGGEWLDVPTTPDVPVVLVGDLLAEWTGDVLTSTLHRVVTPPRELARRSVRHAFAFYQHPDHDVAVDVLPPFVGPADGMSRYALDAGDYLREKYLRQTAPSWPEHRSR